MKGNKALKNSSSDSNSGDNSGSITGSGIYGEINYNNISKKKDMKLG